MGNEQMTDKEKNAIELTKHMDIFISSIIETMRPTPTLVEAYSLAVGLCQIGLNCAIKDIK